METVGVRGPVRVGELCAPRRPRHAPRHTIVPQVSDHGDSAGGEGQTDKELSCLEKHQIQAPAQMISQLRKNSLVSHVPCTSNSGTSNTTEKETSPQGHREGSFIQDDISPETSKPRSVQIMQSLARHSIKHSLTQKPNKALGIPCGNDKLTSQQCSSVNTSMTSVQAVDVGSREMNSHHAEMHNTEKWPAQTWTDSSVDEAACAVSQVSLPESQNHQNKGQHFQSENHQNKVQHLYNTGTPDTSYLVPETKRSGSLESAANPPFTPLLTPRYKHTLQPAVLPSRPNTQHNGPTVQPALFPPPSNSQHNGPAIPTKPVHNAFKPEDLDKSSEWDNPFSRKEGSSGRGKDHQNGPEAGVYSSSQSRRHTSAVSSKSASLSGSSGCKSQSSHREGRGDLVSAKQLSYCKLELSDRGRSFSLTLVSSELNNLMEICALVSEKRDAKILRFGASTEDVVDEMSHQIGVPLVMEKLRVLPAGGRYSAEELVNMSVYPSARKKPADWNELIDKFENEGLEGILLRSKHVKYFEPGERRLPDGEKTFRTGDHIRPRDNRPADQDNVSLLGPCHVYRDLKKDAERSVDTEDWCERDTHESQHDAQLAPLSAADTKSWAMPSPHALTIQATQTGRTVHHHDTPAMVSPTLL